MSLNFRKASFFIVLLSGLAVSGLGQDKLGDMPEAQRLNVMSQKLTIMRRSLTSAASVLRDESKKDKTKKDDPDKADSPLNRLLSLEKEAGRLQSQVTDLHNKIDRNEKFESKEVDELDDAVKELQGRVDKAQLETASARSIPTSPVGKDREKKKNGKFLGIFGKGGNDEYEDLIGNVSPGRDRELFIVATREVRKKNYDVARLLYQTIITTYPDSPYLPMSKLAVGDSFFIEGSTSGLVQAIGSYQDWLTFFPTHPLADRVVLKIAESEMRQIGLPDREITHAKRAETRLKALMQQYPKSFLKPAAEERLKEVQNNLGLHNLGVANYYYTLSVDQKKGGLKGAQARYREIVDKYPNFCYQDEVLYKLAVTYQVEEETDQAARYFQQIVSDYPNSDYVDRATEQLKLIGATVPPANPERANAQKCEQPSFLQNVKNQFFGVYPMTIDKDGVLISRDFDKEKFELIDQIIENQGDIFSNQIPQALTTVISQHAATTAPGQPNQQDQPGQATKITETTPPKK